MSGTFQNLWVQEFEIIFWIKRSEGVVMRCWRGGSGCGRGATVGVEGNEEETVGGTTT